LAQRQAKYLEEAMALKYLFSLSCDSISSEYAGELPAGSRVHIRYSGGELSTNPELYERDWLQGLRDLHPRYAQRVIDVPPHQRADEIQKLIAACKKSNELEALKAAVPKNFWTGLDGSILSGIDWALVRTDGVVSFDARLTLSARTGDDSDFLIEGLMSGAVDLNPAAEHTIAANRKIYADWKSGLLADELPLALGVRFEATGAAPPDASPEYQRKVEHFPRFMRLTRCQCLATGKIFFVSQPGWKSIQRIELEIFEHAA
jgi:hypothetical protein